jgi:hypothetical protein
MTDERVLASDNTLVAGRHRCCGSRVDADIRTALLFRHGHTQRGARLAGYGGITPIVRAGSQQWDPATDHRCARSLLNCRRRGKCHGEWTAHTTFELVHQVHEDGPGAHRARLRCGFPCQRRDSMLDPKAHKGMIRWMVFHSVNASAKPVVTQKRRHVLVRRASVRLPLTGANMLTKRRK